MSYHVTKETGTEAWLAAAQVLSEKSNIEDSRTFRSSDLTRIKEIHHITLTVTDPRQRLIFARPMDPAFALVEVAWIMAGFNSLEFLEFWNALMPRFSDDNITLHGAYGYRLGFRPEQINQIDRLYRNQSDTQSYSDQLHMACEALKESPHTRQVVLQIWQSNADLPDPKVRSKDIPCNITSKLLVRDEKLHWMQDLRSNDLVLGTPYNFMQWMSMQEIVAGWLGLDVGDYMHVVNSLHVYENHWDHLFQILNVSNDIRVPINKSDLRIEGYDKWQKMFAVYVDAIDMFRIATTDEDIRSILDATIGELSAGYYECLLVIAAEACRRKGYPDSGLKLSEKLSDYYLTSWMKWFDHVQKP